jgi:hypothetical protein
MKTFFAGCLVLSLVVRASAQVTVELAQDQEQFLPSESVPMMVKITNRSGQQLHLGADADWLTFSVEAADGFVVIKKAEVPVKGEFDLETSQMGIKRVDLQPYFSIVKPGRYRVIATLHIRDWSSSLSSAPKSFDVIHGAQVWQQDFGVPDGTNSAPEARRYTLEQANHLKDQLRLYVQVSDVTESQIYRVTALGPMVSFSHPEAQVDRMSRLNVLWQTGGQSFSYAIVNPDGTSARTETYDNFTSRPHLSVNQDGEVVVVGGTRRLKSNEMPVVHSPSELPHSVQQTPAPAKK